MSHSASSQPVQNEHPEAGEGGLLSQIKTPAIGNIEAAYSRAGATNNHTPGYASKLGSQDQAPGSQDHQGVGSAKFAANHQDQRQEVSVLIMRRGRKMMAC